MSVNDEKTRTSIILFSNIAEEINERKEEGKNERSNIINRDLERLYTLYKRVLYYNIDITVNEGCLIVDALNGLLVDPRINTKTMLSTDITESIKFYGLGKKWEVDGDALVEKIESLNELECMAIIDAAERFWAKPNEDIEERVKKVFMIER